MEGYPSKSKLQSKKIFNIFNKIEAAINQIQDPKEKRKLLNYWEYSDSFNLNHPQLLDIAATIDLTQDQLITLFRNASKL